MWRARLAALAVLSVAPPARGITIPTADGPPIQLDLTDTADFDYHFYQGNGIISPQYQIRCGAQPCASYHVNPNSAWNPTADYYFDWINKLDAKLTYGHWHAELRIDSALFWNTYDVAAAPVDEQTILLKQLTNRFISNLVLEKISVSYTSPNFEATLGDFYVNYGRGIILSLRKVDQLGVDTTLRGINLTGRLGNFSANLAAGFTNNVNTDQATASVAPDANDPIIAGRIEYRQPHQFALSLESSVLNENYETEQLIGYQPITPPVPPGTGPPYCLPTNNCKLVSIGPLGLGQVGALAGAHYPGMRQRTENIGATLDLPQILEHASAYLEFVHQWNFNYSAPPEGNAFYGGTNIYAGPVTIQLELKDYLNFVAPVQSSLQASAFTNFYQATVYTNPPNLEEIWQEEITTNPLFIWGPRLRVDWQVDEHLRPYIVGAAFVDQGSHWNIYYGLLGIEANWQEHRSHANVSGGTRYELFNSSDRFLQPPTPGFPNPYEYLNKGEWWIQYDIVQSLSPIYSLELDGLHRTHQDCGGAPDCPPPGIWQQGYAYLSIKRTSVTVSGGVEYYTQDPAFQPYYFNASAAWIVSPELLVRAFVGGREAGLRCINGICRLFPGFNGVNLEIVAHY